MSDKPDLPPLLPSGLHPKTLAELRMACVDRFPLSKSRGEIMDGLEAVVQRLEQEGIVGELWVDGSFMTEAIEPADVDLVLWVSAAFYDAATPERQGFMDEWFVRYGGPAVALVHGCHAFLACEFPPGHPSRNAGIRDYWLRQFGTGHDEQTSKGIALVVIGGGIHG